MFTEKKAEAIYRASISPLAYEGGIYYNDRVNPDLKIYLVEDCLRD